MGEGGSADASRATSHWWEHGPKILTELKSSKIAHSHIASGSWLSRCFHKKILARLISWRQEILQLTLCVHRSFEIYKFLVN